MNHELRAQLHSMLMNPNSMYLATNEHLLELWGMVQTCDYANDSQACRTVLQVLETSVEQVTK